MRYRHNDETRRYDDKIGYLNTKIDRLEADNQHFNNEILLVKSSREVLDPPPGGQDNFMSMNDFLSGDWITKPSSISDPPPEKDNQAVIIELCKRIEKMCNKTLHQNEELRRVQDEYVHQFEHTMKVTVKTRKRQNVADVASTDQEVGLGGQDDKISVTTDRPIISISANNPPTSVGDDEKAVGGQVSHRPDNFISATEFIKHEQPPLRKMTAEELFKFFGIIVIAKNNLHEKPINYLVFANLNPYWVCGAHQKRDLVWWIFLQDYYYKKKKEKERKKRVLTKFQR